MTSFRSIIRFFSLILGVVVGMSMAFAAFFARMMIRPPRQPLWETPADWDLPYEDIYFPARDGLRLSGWFIPNAANGAMKPTLILLHGSPWNRLGTTAANILTDLPGSSPLQLLQLVQALYQSGYQLLMFDLRNHGQSASSGPMTFGLGEANDLLGALDYLAGRQDVDEESIGVLGFSVGANTILFTLPRTRLIRAAIAVQPINPVVFSHRFAANLLGLFGKLVAPLAEFMYRLAGGLKFSAMDPAFAVAGASDAPVLFVQGNGDPWGSIDNVALLVEHTPGAVEPLFVETSDRFGGYHHVINHPEIIDSFLRQHLAA